MKQSLAIILFLSLMILFTGCSSQISQQPATATITKTATTTTSPSGTSVTPDKNKVVIEFAELTTDNQTAKWTVSTQMWKPAMGNLNGQPTALTSAFFKTNTSITTDRTGQLLLIFEWTPDGSVLSKEITTRLYNNNHAMLGIFWGDKLICSPSVSGIIMDKGQIDGLSQSEATQLRQLINGGN